MSQVRGSWIGKNRGASTFLDAADWQKVETRGKSAVKAWIDEQLHGTSVTVVLIGEHTSTRPYVIYEIEESYRRGNGMLGIYIHGLKDSKGRESRKGSNPFDKVSIESPTFFSDLLGYKSYKPLSELFKTYYWIDDNGRDNMPKWIEQAATAAGR